MATKRSKCSAGQSKTLTAAGFSGDSRNMRAGGKVPCRVLNDYVPVYANRREGLYHLVAILHGLRYYDQAAPDSVGTFDRAQRPPITDHSKRLCDVAPGWAC